MENLFLPTFILILIVAVICLFLRPHLVLPIFVASIPFQNLAITDVFSIPKILGFLALLAYVYISLKSNGKIKLDFPFWILFFFLIWGTISFFWSKWQPVTQTRIFTLIQLVILYFLLINQIRTFKSLDLVLSVMFWGSMLFALFGFVDFLMSLTNNTGARLASIAQNANVYFIYAITLIPANYWILINKKPTTLKIFAILVLLILFITSLYTQSRGGIISLAVFFLVFLALSKKKFSILAVIGLIILFGLQIMPAEIESRFEGMMVSNRVTDLWPAGIKAFRDHLWFGSGLGTHSYLIAKYLGLSENLSVHNGFLAVGIDLGIIGLSLYLIFFTIPILNLLNLVNSKHQLMKLNKFRQFSVILIAVFFAYLATWVKGGGIEYQKIFWVLAGFLSSVIYLLKSTKVFSDRLNT